MARLRAGLLEPTLAPSRAPIQGLEASLGFHPSSAGIGLTLSPPHVLAVRGVISVATSPASKPWRVSVASATMRSTSARPSGLASSGAWASTMLASCSGAR